MATANWPPRFLISTGYRLLATLFRRRIDMNTWLALDVGGANIKAAHTSGAARALPFELWKRPDELAPVLSGLVRTFPDARWLALTMTAERCDCYATKTEG